MGTINRVPAGLLGLLDAKTQGQTPQDSSGVLSPTIDLTPNYLANIPYTAGLANEVSTTIGLKAILEVPAGELWYVYAVSSEVVASAASQVLTGVPCIIVPGAGGATNYVPLTTCGLVLQNPGAALDSRVHAVSFSVPLLVNPGTQFATRIVSAFGSRTSLTTVLYKAVQV